MDFTSYDDEQLETLRIEIMTEQERRQALANIPTQITALSATYQAGGGDVGFVPTVKGGGGGQDKVAVVGEGSSGVVLAGFLNLHIAGLYVRHNGGAASGSTAAFRFETLDAWPTTLPGTAA